MVQTEGYVYLSDFARGHFSQGKAEGIAEGEAHALLRLLEKRGIELTEAERERVNACTELAILETWFDRAITASTAQEIFS